MLISGLNAVTICLRYALSETVLLYMLTAV